MNAAPDAGSYGRNEASWAQGPKHIDLRLLRPLGGWTTLWAAAGYNEKGWHGWKDEQDKKDDITRSSKRKDVQKSLEIF